MAMYWSGASGKSNQSPVMYPKKEGAVNATVLLLSNAISRKENVLESKHAKLGFVLFEYIRLS